MRVHFSAPNAGIQVQRVLRPRNGINSGIRGTLWRSPSSPVSICTLYISPAPRNGARGRRNKVILERSPKCPAQRRNKQRRNHRNNDSSAWTSSSSKDFTTSPVTAIMGSNCSGKTTTVLDALACAHQPLEPGNPDYRFPLFFPPPTSSVATLVVGTIQRWPRYQ